MRTTLWYILWHYHERWLADGGDNQCNHRNGQVMLDPRTNAQVSLSMIAFRVITRIKLVVSVAAFRILVFDPSLFTHRVLPCAIIFPFFWTVIIQFFCPIGCRPQVISFTSSLPVTVPAAVAVGVNGILGRNRRHTSTVRRVYI